MKKLIELLNEFEDLTEECEQWCIDDYGRISEWWWWSEWTESWICSKKFGFIKWLVDNDKIDRERFYDKARNIISDFDLKWKYEWASNEVIMILAISDTPIYDLISYLR